MRVLGIDPALVGPLGYGVVETDPARRGHYRTLDFGAVKASRRAGSRARANGRASNGSSALTPDPSARLREIHSFIADLVQRYTPDAVAVESVFTALNMKTALKLAEVRGVVMLAAAERDVPVHSYSPREVKSAVAGYGNADKQQMQHMVRVLLGLPRPDRGLPASDRGLRPGASGEQAVCRDAADALAVALCHIYSTEAQARIAAATSSRPIGTAPVGGNGAGRGSAVHASRSPRTNGRRSARIQSSR